jgi:hypothetical protein
MTNWKVKNFTFLETNDTIDFKVLHFVKNSVYCYTKAIPYALLIGTPKKKLAPNLPETITVLAKCDNQVYKIGQKIKVLPIEDPTSNTSLRPLYITKDTIIKNQKFRWLIGSEFPTIWGRVL